MGINKKAEQTEPPVPETGAPPSGGRLPSRMSQDALQRECQELLNSGVRLLPGLRGGGGAEK